mgnify:CR=1 FL=1
MITEKEIENLAELSRIKLAPEEKQSLMKEVGSILAYVDQIKKANITLSQEESVGAVKNITRPDTEVDTSAETREQILNSAPDREKDFVAVKKIIS